MKKLLILVLLPVTVLLMCQTAFAEEDALIECTVDLSCDDALWAECDLGDLTGDAMRAVAETDIALLPGSILRQGLLSDGSISEDQIEDFISSDSTIFIIALTPVDLKELLEESASHWVTTSEDELNEENSAYEFYLQISGFSVKYDASATAGDRVLSVTLDGEDEGLDLSDNESVITAAVTDSIADGAGTDLGVKVREALKSYIVSQGAVSLEKTDRVTVIGVHMNDIIDFVPRMVFIFLLPVFVISGIVFTKREREVS